MKKSIGIQAFILGFLFLMITSLSAQQFELPQISTEDFHKTGVSVGGDFAIQYQMLEHYADSALIPLGTGFNLPTANFSIIADLAEGIRVNVETYLSSRHHNETWVKGGYLLIDELPFIHSEGIKRAMDLLTVKVGNMELDYGDAHYRRTDNGRATTNPFVGNYIMDAFTTAPAIEIMFRRSGWLFMGAVTTGSLRQDLVRYSDGSYTSYDAHKELGVYWKAGIDKQLHDELRTRLTVSGYHMPARNHNNSLYGGDRTGSRYYLVMKRVTDSSSDTDIKSGHTTGRWSPSTANKTNSLMVNLFTLFKGFEFFGTYEIASGNYASGDEFRFSQIGVEGLLRFGGQEQFYAGARYNLVKGNPIAASDHDRYVNRIQIGGGCFMLKSTVLKFEYVKQNYRDFITDYGEDAGFNGMMIEAAISF
ncbi:MAG: hypothetical protein JXA61_04495 [Bacteroidales bacterium]|nr:hypothetical protein [Bacteroidales bacterium]